MTSWSQTTTDKEDPWRPTRPATYETGTRALWPTDTTRHLPTKSSGIHALLLEMFAESSQD